MPATRPTAILLGLALLAGCGGPVSKDNFERVKAGMKKEVVDGILGDGVALSASELEGYVKEKVAAAQGDGKGPKIEIDLGNARGVRYGSEKKNVTVVYAGDKVMMVHKNGF